jgi:small conductance mechanosensitive channel
MAAIWDQIKQILAVYGLNVLAAIAIFVLGRIAASWVRKIIRKLMVRREADMTLIGFVCNLCYAGMMAFVIIAAVSKLGVQTASFVAVLASAGLAVGLALQGSLSNFAAGVLMVIFKPFKAGDYIDGGGASGTVEEISIFTTVLKTADNKKVIVPNSKMMGDNITNYTARDIRRIDLAVGVSYSDDIDRVKSVILDVLSREPRVLQEPPAFTGLLEMADSRLQFAVRPWVRTDEYWDVRFDLNESLKKRFDSEGITIPFPQSDVHLYHAEQPGIPEERNR